ncbi:MAG: ArsR family transcriptional regulator, partial [Nitrosopumilaceae archaeon]|nr:ArsR family transcriptional regulator [Nitrosopumilaceae archaeon]
IRGTVIKFYTSRALLFDFNIPNNFDSNYEKIINRISVKLEKILNELMTQKSYCNFKTKNEDYNKFIIVEIINSALLNILYKK